jgi:hypothetical protein
MNVKSKKREDVFIDIIIVNEKNTISFLLLMVLYFEKDKRLDLFMLFLVSTRSRDRLSYFKDHLKRNESDRCQITLLIVFLNCINITR